ncbi:hypothetical protein BZG36_02023 [Bifiguratus adelaidae]|uniref:DUF1748-domain-containing protein n=1 Tax=Bifiguratus adelaidae TaxID=1938954 RepID=A0A261Y213_9FUNG|nr:hypothetical protein BZG36_02023 [Bifiguratus adelaidae]
MFGRVLHLAADAILISAVLAGIKRSTGLTVATSKIENRDLRLAVERYLEIGEWVIDMSTVFMNRTRYFERKR